MDRRRGQYHLGGPVPIIIKIKVKEFVMAFLLFVLGIVVWSLTKKYSNDFPKLTQQHCPALNGKIYDWTANLGIILMIMGFLGFCTSGIISKIFLGIQFRMESVCCGHFFMGVFGLVLNFLGLLILSLYNVYGSFILRELNPSNTQTLDHYPDEDAKTYCNKIILNLFKTMHIFVYVLIGSIIIFYLVKCGRKIKEIVSEDELIDPLDEFEHEGLEHRIAKALEIDMRAKEEIEKDKIDASKKKKVRSSKMKKMR